MKKNNLFLKNKYYKEESVFSPENLLREARRQKSIDKCDIPEICIFDPDGDIVKYLEYQEKLEVNRCWSCYHTTLYSFKLKDLEFGIIGCVVGSSFAVLVAEELFASGCRLLVSMTSAGKIYPHEKNPRFILIKNALRDEGTSYHYMEPSNYSKISDSILDKLNDFLNNNSLSVDVGNSWTTDAPFRETGSSIEYAKSEEINAVEMEAAALYAFSRFKNKDIVCIAHLTNTMAQSEGDFEKGIENGSVDSLEVIYAIANALMA